MTRLTDRYGPVALVTGTSDGIGRAVAVAMALAQAGFDLILVARRAERLRVVAADIDLAHGRRAVVLPVDMSDPHALPAALDAHDAQVGLVVAAAGYGLAGPLTWTDLEDELAMIDVNCKAVLTLSRWSVDHMTDRRRGGLVLFSSLVAFQGVPRSANYAATKAWNQVFAEGLVAETPWMDILAVAPGPVATGFGARSGIDTSSGATPDAVARAILRALPRGGTLRPVLSNKILQGGLSALPRKWRTAVLGRAMASMMRH